MYNLPTIRTVEDCEREFPDIITITRYNTYEKFDELYYKVYYALCACIEVPACISYRVKFKFYPEDTIIYDLSLPKFLLNLNSWRPLIELASIEKYYHNKLHILDESFIVGTMMSNAARMGLESKVVKTLNDYGIPFERISELLKVVIERYQEASVEFAVTDSSAVMTYESIFLNDYRKSEKLKELNNIEIDQSLQTSEVEALLKEKTKELINELGVTKNPLWYVSKAGNHVKEKQVQELFLSYGQIPDISGNVIPYTMQGNGFRTGYNDIASYYIAGTGARLSGVVNKTYMGDAGYLSRNLILMSRTLTLSKTVYDCGTNHLLPITVTDSTFLHRLENRWYKEHEGDRLKVIHYHECKHLIGKRILLRSLLTCACGDEVCHVCYGNDSHLVMNMPGMAIFNTEVYSEPVGQNILSTKHLLFTKATVIKFSDNFHKYFKYSAGDIYVKDRDEFDDNIPVEDLSIRIPEENVINVNEQDIVDYNTFGNHIISPIYVYNHKTKEYDMIEISNYESMFIDSESIAIFNIITDKSVNKKYYEIHLDELNSELDGRLNSIDIKNNGLTDNLHMIMNMINKDVAKYDDYSKLAQDFFDIFIAAGINCRHIQPEIILNRLIRDANDLHKRPDFRKFKLPEYKLLTLNQALLNTPAPTIGISYQEVKRQILSDEIYDKKNAGSFMDPMFANKVNANRLKELARKVQERRNKDGR